MRPVFRLRDEHMQAFAAAARESFEDRMYAHLHLACRARCDELGETTARKWIRDGVNAAAQYQITREQDVSRYLRLMFQLGRSFDSGQASAMLSRQELPPAVRLNRVLTMATTSGALPGGSVRETEA